MELADSHFLFLWMIATLPTNQKFLKVKRLLMRGQMDEFLSI
jgi:hypothetical protein